MYHIVRPIHRYKLVTPTQLSNVRRVHISLGEVK